MEENKTNTVSMNNQASEQPEKMSYEQLENIAHQLSDKLNQVYGKLQESNMTNMFKRLDYLFKVVENARAFNDSFVESCVRDIEDLMTIPEETVEE